MYHVHSAGEKAALVTLLDLGARLAETPDDESLRRVYRVAHQRLREHSRAGALITRIQSPPARPRVFNIDPAALSDYLSGVAS